MIDPAWSYVLTLIGVTGLLLAGRKQRTGWIIGFCAQGLWATYAVTTGQYGFLIGCMAYGYVYALNWFTWKRSDKAEEKQTPEQRLQELAYQMLSTASPAISVADRVRYAEVLIRFSKTAAAWEEKQQRPRMPRARRR